MIADSDSIIQSVINELRYVMSLMNSQFVMNIVAKVSNSLLFGFVMELCALGDLRQYIAKKEVYKISYPFLILLKGPLPILQIKYICAQIILGLD